jgi:hypothetical protein
MLKIYDRHNETGAPLMKPLKAFSFYAVFPAVSAVFLIIEHLTHIEFFLHLAAIPIEVMVAVFIVERLLERKENRDKRRQLMFIKSTMFRSDMRSLFIANFEALKMPAINLARIRAASLEELRRMREEAEKVEYKSAEDTESVIMEYVRSQHVWKSFMERAITYNFEEIFHDMIYILHFIYDVQTFKDSHPGKLFMSEAFQNKDLLAKVMKVLGDGIRRFLDYAVELKEKQPHMFDDVLSDYDLASQMKRTQVDA